MNRGSLALGAAVALAAVLGLGLYILVRKDDDATAQHDPAAKRTPGIDPVQPVVRVPQAQPHGDNRPALSGDSGSAAGEYTVGDVRIRDHRSGVHAPIDIPPAIHPPEGRKIPSQLTSDIAQRLRAVVTECAASVPPQDPGAKPHLDGEILIAIKNQQATVTSATFQPREVASASQDAVKQCMEQKSVGVTTPSGDEPDVEAYAITLSLRLP